MDRQCYGCFELTEESNPICHHCGYDDHGNINEFVLRPGTELENRYIIGKTLGIGGFGITYLALDKRINLKVAVKEFFMKKSCSRNISGEVEVLGSGKQKRQFRTYKEKFIGEAHLLANYQGNDGIVGVSDYFNQNNTAYLVMEYLEGMTLEDALKKNTKYNSFDSLIELLLPIMNALKEVHVKGYIHRDISPDNIFQTNEGQMKLLDFGAARESNLDNEKKLSVILKNGYAPIEQYEKNGKQGPFTDIYALGATIYRMLEGKKLTDASERLSLDQSTEFDNMRVALNDKEKSVFLKMLAVDQKDRYQNIEELLEDLGVSISLKDAHRRRRMKIRLPDVVIKSMRISAYMFCMLAIVFLGMLYSFENVKDWTGLDYGLVVQEISESKLQTTVIFEYSENVEKGYIIEQKVADDWYHRWNANQISVSKGSGKELKFKDKNLEKEILKISKSEDGIIRAGDLLGLTSVNLSDRSIESISGIEQLTELTELNLSANSISDLKPLEELKDLKVLNLHRNAIRDIRSIRELVNLRTLVLSENSLTDISELENVTTLVELNLNSNNISNISPIYKLENLETLILGNNMIKDISGAEELIGVKTLVLSENRIEEIGNLTDLENLEFLSLRDNSLNMSKSLQHMELINSGTTVVEY